MSRKTGDRKYTPAVARYWLMLAAGLLWSGVGTTLCVVACYWLSLWDWPKNGEVAAVGASMGALVYRFGFSVIARRNIMRIAKQPETVCFFAFLGWRSYLLIMVMALIGFVLRQSHLSRVILATIYLTVGTGLVLSSSLYYEDLM